MRVGEKLIGVLAVVVLLLAACGPAATETPPAAPTKPPAAEATPTTAAEPEEPETPTSVTIAQGIDAESLDPAYETSAFGMSAMSNVYDALLARDASGKLIPSLAVSWEFVEPTILEVQLRQGVMLHSGEEFTADDVVFSFERALDEENPVPLTSIIAGTVESVEKVDTYTVRVHTPTPKALLLAELARFYIVSKIAVEEAGESYGSNPVGTGPYRLVRWDKNERMVFEAFDEHWRGRPEVDDVVIKVIPDEFARFAALKTGEVDIIASVLPERIEEVEADPDLKLVAAHSTRTMYVALNTFAPPFDDVRVRQAFNYAIDAQTLVDTVLGGHGYPNGSVCNQTTFGYDADFEGYGYDPDKARALLAEAGYADGLTVQMAGPTGRYTKDKEMQEAIAAQLAEVGVTVEHYMPEWAQLLEEVRGGELQMHFLACGNPLLDCDLYMVYRFVSDAAFAVYYNKPELDELIRAEQAEVDEQKRQEILTEIQLLIEEDAPWIFLYDQEDLYGIRARIDYQPRPDEQIWSYDIHVSE